MANEREIEIVITAVDQYTAELRKATNSVNKFATRATRAFVKVGRSVTKFVRELFSLRRMLTTLAAGAAVGYGLKRLAGLFIDAGSTTEQLRVRLSALLGSQEEGARLFKEMADFASRVPFEFQEVMASSTQLAGVLKGGVDEITAWMPLIGDLAAVAGVNIQKATEQVVRMLSAGAQSAELFKERGTLELLGFTAGVSFSAEETRRILIDSWEKTGSRFRGVTEELAKTWEGKMSMLKDAWFQFKDSVAQAGFLDFAKDTLDDILEKIDELKESGTLKEWAEDTSKALEDMFTKIKEGAPHFLNIVAAVGWLIGKTVALTDHLAKVAAWMVINAEAGRGVTVAWKDFGNEVGTTSSKIAGVTLDIEDASGTFVSLKNSVTGAAKAIMQARLELAQMAEAPDLQRAGSLPPVATELIAMDERLALIEEFHNKKLTLLWAANASEVEIQAAHEEKKRAMDAQTNQMRATALVSTLGVMANAMSQFSNLANAENKKQFKLYKAFAIGQAFIATFLGATKALAEVPYPLNIVAMVSIIAAGVAQVKKIKAQKFGGSSSGATASAGGGTVSGGATTPGAAIGGGVSAPEVPAQLRPLNITFQIHTLEGKDINMEKLWEDNLKPIIENDAARGGTLQLNVAEA